ncbi:glucuronate isomerase [Lachnoclostridium sp. Marseille-P6806]|uniref:glucuronate isomerase n=1 Tax=Lachnoclostridium sp. Marseille-P6806 TaxID=2364793 RepID=UPI001030310B|nr:glucuronate isomerase [Lachnoclostridium sp. Marseille-P6806]
MKEFMGEDFLLDTETAKRLYDAYAKDMPIIDYHCHLSPQEIYEDVRFGSITELWLGADHYKWRQMRANGTPERFITGNGDDFEKFRCWAKTLEAAVGNPLYHWSHLELKRYFGFGGQLCEDNAREVWELCNEKLRSPEMSARGLIRSSHVELLCTTDDPADSLEYHRKLREEDFSVRVLPAWRPDRAIDIEKADYADYMKKLSEVSGVRIEGFAELLEALRARLRFFADNGCSISDHGLAGVVYEPASFEEADRIFRKRLAGETLSGCERRKFRTVLMLALGEEYAQRNWVMQLHYGVQRNLNRRLFEALGPDAGADAIGDQSSAAELGRYLDALAEKSSLPKTIVYSLNPADNAVIDTIIGCFQDDSAVGKLQHGSAWWFNDHRVGMEAHMTSLANLGLLGNFIGMLTDSRSFLSYTRHEYFRRILCGFIGRLVENGEYPNDERLLRKLVEGISYRNAKRYFGF